MGGVCNQIPVRQKCSVPQKVPQLISSNSAWLAQEYWRSNSCHEMSSFAVSARISTDRIQGTRVESHDASTLQVHLHQDPLGTAHNESGNFCESVWPCGWQCSFFVCWMSYGGMVMAKGWHLEAPLKLLASAMHLAPEPGVADWFHKAIVAILVLYIYCNI